MTAPALLVLSLLSAGIAGAWPGWRGDGSGTSPETSLPHAWSATEQLRWRVPVPGEGLSSPIVWQDKLFLTTAISEPEWSEGAQALRTALAVLAPVVLLLALRGSAFVSGPRSWWGIFARLLLFLSVAALVLFGCQQLRVHFPAQVVALCGRSWQPDAEQVRSLPGEWFLASVVAAVMVLGVGAIRNGFPAPATAGAASAWLCWLQGACIVAMAGAFLSENHRFLAVFLVLFAGCRLGQFCVERFRRDQATAEPCEVSLGARLLSELQAIYALGMAGTFLVSLGTYLLDPPLPTAVSPCLLSAEIGCLGLIAALGVCPARWKLRMLFVGLALIGLAVWTRPIIDTDALDESWQQIHQARFEVYAALTVVSGLWFLLDSRRRAREAVEGFSASLGLVGLVLLFAVLARAFPPVAAFGRHVVCLDAAKGSLRWQRRCTLGGNPAKLPLDSLAIPTPVTDGAHVYADFGEAGTYCLDMAGRLIWSHVEPVATPPFGFASSLVLRHDLVVVTYDLMAISCTLALDKTTGQPRWRADRTGLINVAEGNYLYGYSTPTLLEAAAGTQLVTHAGGYLFSYDLATGKELWRLQNPGYAVVVSPVVWHQLVLFGGAPALGRERCVSAVETLRDENGPKARPFWRARRIYADVPSPVVWNEAVYTVTRDGLASCLDVRTGKVRWTQRLGGIYEASVVAADDKVFFCNTAGVTTVIAAAPVFQLRSRNALDESVRASPAIAGGRLYLRGERHLFCIGIDG